MDETKKPFVGSPADVRQWAENRRTVNALEVRELRATWNSAERSFWAARAMLALFASVNGWPAPEDRTREREVAVVRDRYSILRSRLRQ